MNPLLVVICMSHYPRQMFRSVILLPPFLLSSCILVSPAVKVVEKAATTSIGVAGKAAGAGIDVVKSAYKKGTESELPAPPISP